MKKHYLKLAPTEQALLNASAAIFSAFVAAGKYDASKEQELTETSVNIAIALANRIEDNVAADDEVP